MKIQINRINQRLFAAMTAGLAASSFATENPKTTFKFDFGNGQPAPGYTKITPTTMYTDELGYGLAPGSTAQAVERGSKNPVRDDFLTSDQPFYFSVKAPEEGNYRRRFYFHRSAARAVQQLGPDADRIFQAGNRYEGLFSIPVKRPLPDGPRSCLKPNPSPDSGPRIRGKRSWPTTSTRSGWMSRIFMWSGARPSRSPQGPIWSRARRPLWSSSATPMASTITFEAEK